MQFCLGSLTNRRSIDVQHVTELATSHEALLWFVRQQKLRQLDSCNRLQRVAPWKYCASRLRHLTNRPLRCVPNVLLCY